MTGKPTAGPAMMPLVKALRRQRPALKRLLAEARVPVPEAEDLLLAALREIPDTEWARMPRPQIDDELLRRVGAACARFATVQSLPAPAAAKGRGRRARGRRKR